MSWATSPVTTAPAPRHTPRGLGMGAMSRGRQLEAAVDSLSAWYFEYDAPQSKWYDDRIHPWPEEGGAGEQQPQVETDYQQHLDHDAWAPRNASNEYAKPSTDANASANAMSGRYATSDEELKSSNQVDDQDKSTTASTILSTRSERQSTTSIRQAAIGSTTSAVDSNELTVTGYTIRGREKKVMYHIDVRCSESQLQTYTIRRSYTDFKHLHIALMEAIEARREFFTSRPKFPGSRHSIPEKESRAMSARDRSSVDVATRTSHSRHSHDVGSDEPNQATVEPWFMTFTLPPLPHAGFLSFWKRHDRTHLQNRCEMFQEILRAAMEIPELRESYAMQNFLSVAPCAIRERGSSYVSLCEYSVPQIDPEAETRERKKLARERRRNSSALIES